MPVVIGGYTLLFIVIICLASLPKYDTSPCVCGYPRSYDCYATWDAGKCSYHTDDGKPFELGAKPPDGRQHQYIFALLPPIAGTTSFAML